MQTSLRLLAAAALLTLGSACASTHSASAPPTGVNAKPGSAALSHGRSAVATPANGSTSH